MQMITSFVQLLPNTYPVTYLGAGRDEGYFRDKREMLKDVEMPPTAIRLTWNEVYDSSSKLMVAWEPWENPVDVDDYLHIRAAPQREVLGPMIRDYRTMKYLATPRGAEFNPELYAESGGVPQSSGTAIGERWWNL